ncbi:secreted RxLR effector protein 161-like [Apium graveolens]|uniref:secreted RxLR effector protein 161-like n=1 Tax=Apium graveolens TaxID=4045 RepID=UPI003D7919B3
MERPTILHLSAVKRILRYLKGTLQFGLVYSEKGGNNIISGYSDSDMGGTVDDRKSTGGMAYYLNESLISWVSQKQRCVALSSCEAELMAAIAAASQGIWSKHIDIRYHFIRECVERDEVIVKHVSSGMQQADSLTKAMTTIKFERTRDLLGVQQLDKKFEIKGRIVG